MWYVDLGNLPVGYVIIQKKDGEYIRDPEGIFYKFTRNANSKYVCVEADYVDGNTPHKGWKTCSSRSGVFVCDEKGRLRRFIRSERNGIHLAQIGELRSGGFIFKDLIIPEGIRQIGSIGTHSFIDDYAGDGFKNIIVLDEIQFPNSLKIMGFGCFYNSCLPDVVFPESLEKLDGYAFAGSRIRKLTIPANMKKVTVHYEGVMDPAQYPRDDELWITGRSFKEAEIEELACPEDFNKWPLMPEAGIVQIKRAAKRIL